MQLEQYIYDNFKKESVMGEIFYSTTDMDKIEYFVNNKESTKLFMWRMRVNSTQTVIYYHRETKYTLATRGVPMEFPLTKSNVLEIIAYNKRLNNKLELIIDYI